MKILITGGAGFIGSAVVRQYIQDTRATVINVDKLTYAGNLESLALVQNHPRHIFEQADITDRPALERIFHLYRPDAVMHLAAETHVDRSIDGPAEFINTNILGTYTLLETARTYWSGLAADRRSDFRLLHISTDEVYGSLDNEGLFSEASPYDPSSPYSASKAASDHLVRAWHRTYRFPAMITNCSNNYGPYQFPEKLIPLMILNALEGKPLPVYGEGKNIRDWLYVEDHARALRLVLAKGRPGETYNIGGHCEKTNIEVVNAICDILSEMRPISTNRPLTSDYRHLISFVPDRPGHDFRYALDASKIQRELGWRPEESFRSGLEKTVSWYVKNQDWCARVQDGQHCRERLGLNV